MTELQLYRAITDARVMVRREMDVMSNHILTYFKTTYGLDRNGLKTVHDEALRAEVACQVARVWIKTDRSNPDSRG